MDLGLRGKRVLVTGASRGTGSAIAAAFAREGAVVVVHGLAEIPPDSVVREILEAGGDARGVTGDPTTDAGATEMTEQVVEVVGGVDVLVNNLGRPSVSKWASAETADFLAAYEVNTLSAVRMIRAFVDGMRAARWGRVIQLATIGTTRPGARMPDYYAAKGALATLTVSLARELQGSGVTANTVSPGLIRTPETEAFVRHLADKRGWDGPFDAVEARAVKEMTGAGVGRMAAREEVADLVVFVASERAGYLNGANFRIDGGATETVN